MLSSAKNRQGQAPPVLISGCRGGVPPPVGQEPRPLHGSYLKYQFNMLLPLLRYIVFLSESTIVTPIGDIVKAQCPFDRFGKQSFYNNTGSNPAETGRNTGSTWIDFLFPGFGLSTFGAF